LKRPGRHTVDGAADRHRGQSVSDGGLLLKSRVNVSLANGPGNAQPQEAENSNEAIPVARRGNVPKHAVILPAAKTPLLDIVGCTAAYVNAVAARAPLISK
jgi:hypothetical protein